MTKHIEFITDLRSYLESCCKQSHENMANSSFHRAVNMASISVVEGEIPPTTTFCKHTSFAAKYLLDKLYGEKFTVAGGHCKSLFLNAEDTWKKETLSLAKNSEKPISEFEGNWLINNKMECFGAHWWLEKDNTILDISADQFGHDSIIITSSDDPRFIKNKEASKASKISGARATTLKWLNNDFGFWNKMNKYNDELNDKYKGLQDKYPEFKSMFSRKEEVENGLSL